MVFVPLTNNIRSLFYFFNSFLHNYDIRRNKVLG